MLKRLLAALLLLALARGAAAFGGVPAFTLKRLDGTPFNSTSVVGKRVVVVVFWATWCEPCHKILKQLQRLKDRYPGVQVLAISVDDGRSMAAINQDTQGKGYTFTVLLDSDTNVMRMFNPSQGVPYTLVIDRAGQVAYRRMGYLPGDEHTLFARIAELR